MYAVYDKLVAGLAALFFIVPFVAGCALPVAENDRMELTEKSLSEPLEKESTETVTDLAVTETESKVAGVVEGELNKRVAIDLPDNWVTEKEEDVWEGGERDSYVHHVKGETLEEKLAEGLLFQSEVAFIEGGLQNTFDYAYAECVMNNPEPAEGEDVLYVPCIKDDLKDWEEIDFGNGVKGYRSDIVGVPESGEEMEEYYIVFEDLNEGVYFRAVYAESKPVSREDQYKIVDGLFDSITVE